MKNSKIHIIILVLLLFLMVGGGLFYIDSRTDDQPTESKSQNDNGYMTSEKASEIALQHFKGDASIENIELDESGDIPIYTATVNEFSEVYTVEIDAKSGVIISVTSQ